MSEQEKAEEGLGPNIKSIVTMLMLMLLMMFAVHCTWVTSNAYSSPSVVLASYNHDGYKLRTRLTCSMSASFAMQEDVSLRLACKCGHTYAKDTRLSRGNMYIS